MFLDAAAGSLRRSRAARMSEGTKDTGLAGQKARILNLIGQQRLPDALAACQAVCAAEPGEADNWFMLATLQGQTGRLQEAAGSFRQALAIRPGHQEARFHFGRLQLLLGQTAAAEASFRAVIAATPRHVDAHLGLAAALQAQSHTGEALVVYDDVLRLQPRAAAAWYGKGVLQQVRGEMAAAEQSLRHALECQPGHAQAWLALGVLLFERGDVAAAGQALRNAVRYQPDSFEARLNLGKLLQSRLQFTAAGESLVAALALRPDSADASNELGLSLNARGDTAAAEQAFRKAIEFDPGMHAAASNLLLTLNYHARYSPQQIHDEHVRLGRLLGTDPRRDIPFGNRADPLRRLRIGYLSADFRDHSVASFFQALPQYHDRDGFEVFCYANVARPDAVTRYLQGLADGWRDIHGRTDADVAAMVRDDAIDILVDLGGHTAGNRLPVFAARAAPLQVTWLGYPNTTGVPAMDIRLTDDLADPPGSDACYSERLVRLPGCFLCYRPLTDVPLPDAREPGGPVTFGSFNSYLKITPGVLETWAAILCALPESRLLLKNFSLTDPGVRAACLERLVALGADPQRIDLYGVLAAKADHLALYSQVDIALDTFPYNGTTTTCEALWMGVPVITLAGDRHAGRVGVSLLSALGLPQLVAVDRRAYVELAVRIAGDAELRRQWRSGLREQMQGSALCDGEAFCRNVETVWRELWADWCSRR